MIVPSIDLSWADGPCSCGKVRRSKSTPAIRGLSVFSFLRRPSWLSMAPEDDAYEGLLLDTAALARLEGLEAHARSAELRLTSTPREEFGQRVQAS